MRKLVMPVKCCEYCPVRETYRDMGSSVPYCSHPSFSDDIWCDHILMEGDYGFPDDCPLEKTDDEPSR